MPRPARRISYVGCVMAGKMYSLYSVLVRNRQPLPEPFSALRERPHDFVLTRDDAPLVEISVQIADRRATAIDYDLTSGACDPSIRAEMAEIAQADGLVVVLDSRAERMEANIGAFARLQRDLSISGVDPHAMPMVFQANKRDVSNIVTMDWVRANFRSEPCAYVESVATKAIGTVQAMRELLRLTGAID